TPPTIRRQSDHRNGNVAETQYRSAMLTIVVLFGDAEPHHSSRNLSNIHGACPRAPIFEFCSDRAHTSAVIFNMHSLSVSNLYHFYSLTLSATLVFCVPHSEVARAVPGRRRPDTCTAHTRIATVIVAVVSVDVGINRKSKAALESGETIAIDL